jgi:branched-chain amino acid transport system permease protein
MSLWADIIFSGLIIGALYVLVGHGFNLAYLTTRTFNLAQGQFVAMGGLLAYWTVTSGLPYAALIAVIAFVALVGLLQERLSITPILKRGDSEVWLVSTLGVSIFIQGALAAFFGQEPLHVDLPFADDIIAFAGTRQSIGGYVVVAAALIVTALIVAITRFTWAGRALQAVAEDPTAAKALGINTALLISCAFMVAAALGGLTGIVAAPVTYAHAALGSSLLIQAFIVLAIGGFGSTGGLLLVGFALGVFESVVKFLLGGEYASILVFLILLFALMVRPQGLFAGKAPRTV